MDVLQQQSNYHDLGQLDELRSAAQQDPNKALQTVAKQFEAMFMQMLLKQMRQSNQAFETDSPLNNRHTQTYRDMHDKQMAVELSSSGALGLADLIVAQLNPESSNMTPASLVRNGADIKALSATSFPVTQKIGTQAALSTNVTAATSDSLAEKPQQVEKVTAEAATSTEQQRQSFASPKEFIESVLPAVRKLAKEQGIDPVAVVAQAALETGWGKKVIQNRDGSSSHNLFGIKADRRWQGDAAVVTTLEYRDGQAKREQAAFRSYSSIEDSIRDYLSFLKGPRYQNAVAHGGNPQRYVQELQKAGYATDPLYADKITSIMQGKHFAEFNNLAQAEQ